MNNSPFQRHAKVDDFSTEELTAITLDSASWRELQRRLGYGSTNASARKVIQTRLDYYGISYDHFTSSHAMLTKRRTPENTFVQDSTACHQTVTSLYKKGEYSEYKCSICGLPPIWNDKPLTLTLDHINGNHTDNRIENLRWVCPNCDRQLDTFAGRNHNRYNHLETALKEEYKELNEAAINSLKGDSLA